MEVITDLLKRALHTDDASASKALVQRAYDVASGLDDYLEAVSSPPSQVEIRATSCCCPTGGRARALSRPPTVTVLVARCVVLQVCKDLIQASMAHDWDQAFEEVCHLAQIKSCSTATSVGR